MPPLTKQDIIAIAAMQAFISAGWTDYSEIARKAYAMADLMEKEKNEHG